MANIQMTEQLAGALIERMKAEYGQQAVSNFALDMLLDSANGEIVRLSQINAGLMERIRVAEETIEAQKRSTDPHRERVMGAADRVKQMKANGANPNSK